MKYTWENYASVEMLSHDFNVSKRRIQQILAKLKEQEKLEVVVGVFFDEMNPYARPFYRRLDV